MRELSPLAVGLGVVIAVLFGAANAYIGLKVGLTVSASIPAAVIALAVLRGILKRGTILESNIVQTIGSSGESLAAGMIFTIPALFIFAATTGNMAMIPSILEMTIWGCVGGLLGVLCMIPLRRLLIVREHGKLPYPEGTACAEVLQSGQQGGAGARLVFGGLAVAGVYEFFRGLGFWRETAAQNLPLVRSEFSVATEPALLGVGYILGVRIAAFMLSGAVLGWFVLIPAIQFFGAGLAEPIAPATVPIAEMSAGDIYQKYVRYVGAGAVVLGGLLSLLRSLGTIGSSFLSMFSGAGTRERTDRDIPAPLLVLSVLGLGAAMWFLPDTGLMNPLLKSIPVIACVLVFGFFFVTVSSRLVGLVGSSSNPISGMTIATLLGASVVVIHFTGLTGSDAKLAIISIGALVCIAAAIAGDASQDLKTGYLVGATPWKQQVAEIIGVLVPAAAIAALIHVCSSVYGFHADAAHPNAFLAPQANIIKLLVEGIVDGELPWTLLLAGVAAALVVELLGIHALPFAVGLYLPLSLSTPIMLGALIRWLVERFRKPLDESHDPGVLAASGLVAGQGLVGVFFVLVTAGISLAFGNPRFVVPAYDDQTGQLVAPDAQPAAATAPASQVAATQPETPAGELVISQHFFPWLTTVIPGLKPEYGLPPLKLEQAHGPFRGQYAVRWEQLLPIAPFLLVALWLFLAARRPPPAIDTAEPDAPPGP